MDCMSNCKKCGVEFTPTKGLINYCTIQCRNSRVFSEKTNEKKRNSNLGQIPWNKGKTSGEESLVKSICLFCGNEIIHTKWKPKKYHAECWTKCSGGYRKGSGVGKGGWYKGYWCDSSYELAWVIFNIEHGNSFVRNTQEFEYVWEGKKRKYVPDFIINGELIEIKGYTDEHIRTKLKSVSNLQVIYKENLKKEFEYVEGKYGKDFIRLYEENPHKKLTNECRVCGKSCQEENVYCSRTCAGVGNNRNSKTRKK